MLQACYQIWGAPSLVALCLQLKFRLSRAPVIFLRVCPAAAGSLLDTGRAPARGARGPREREPWDEPGGSRSPAQQCQHGILGGPQGSCSMGQLHAQAGGLSAERAAGQSRSRRVPGQDGCLQGRRGVRGRQILTARRAVPRS